MQVRAVLDSGAHITSVSMPIVETLESLLPGVQLRIPFSMGPRQAVMASGQRVDVTERTVPLQLSFQTSWGQATLEPTSYAIMPGTDTVVILGLSTMNDLGVNPYTRLLDVMRPRMTPPSPNVETPAYLGSLG